MYHSVLSKLIKKGLYIVAFDPYILKLSGMELQTTRKDTDGYIVCQSTNVPLPHWFGRNCNLKRFRHGAGTCKLGRNKTVGS